MRIDLETLEERVFTDINIARTSYSIIDSFIAVLWKRSERRFKAISKPIIDSIAEAATNSAVISLGRLLNPSDRYSSECTLIKYKNRVVDILSSRNTDNWQTPYSKECLIRVKDPVWEESFMKMQEDYKNELKPIRDKIIAHSDAAANYEESKRFLPIILKFIEFTEETHKTLRAAHQDAGMDSPYLSHAFTESVDEWLKILGRNWEEDCKYTRQTY